MKQSQYNLMFLIFFFVTSLCLWKVDSGVQQALNEVDMLIPYEVGEQDLILKQILPNPKFIDRTEKVLSLSEEETHCLALNVYWEARNQDTPGQIAVAFVTINRKLNKHFKNTVCEVIKQGYRKKHGSCAFSWFCDGLSDRPKDKKAWKHAQRIAEWTIEYYYTQSEIYTEKPTHYHADYIKQPWWAKNMKRITKIGDHIFYAGV
jgi:spore germination cell wall hydrolase CwlJ-like protein